MNVKEIVLKLKVLFTDKHKDDQVYAYNVLSTTFLNCIMSTV